MTMNERRGYEVWVTVKSHDSKLYTDLAHKIKRSLNEALNNHHKDSFGVVEPHDIEEVRVPKTKNIHDTTINYGVIRFFLRPLEVMTDDDEGYDPALISDIIHTVLGIPYYSNTYTVKVEGSNFDK